MCDAPSAMAQTGPRRRTNFDGCRSPLGAQQELPRPRQARDSGELAEAGFADEVAVAHCSPFATMPGPAAGRCLDVSDLDEPARPGGDARVH